MIAIVNYGLGNLKAFINIFNRLNIPLIIAETNHELVKAEKIILPGVGAFDWAMRRLNESGLRDPLEKLVLVKKIPILGVCVGMQMMAKRSEEGVLDGLGWIDGEVKKFGQPSSAQKIHLPHMGWNDVRPRGSNGLFRDIESEARFYFLHSYYLQPNQEEEMISVTDYGGPFASSVCSGNVFGVQFHPEKSHQWGIQLLKNFAEL
jgi:glutamine amidotransferase